MTSAAPPSVISPTKLLKERAEVWRMKSLPHFGSQLTVRQAIEKHEKGADECVVSGYTYTAEGRYEEAKKIFMQAHELKPSCIQTMYSLCCISALCGDASACSKWMLAAVDATPKLKKPCRVIQQNHDSDSSTSSSNIIVPQHRYRILTRQKKAPKQVRTRVQSGTWTGEDMAHLMKGIRWIVENTNQPDDVNRCAERMKCPWIPLGKAYRLDAYLKRGGRRTIGPPEAAEEQLPPHSGDIRKQIADLTNPPLRELSPLRSSDKLPSVYKKSRRKLTAHPHRDNTPSLMIKPADQKPVFPSLGRSGKHKVGKLSRIQQPIEPNQCPHICLRNQAVDQKNYFQPKRAGGWSDRSLSGRPSPLRKTTTARSESSLGLSVSSEQRPVPRLTVMKLT